MTFSFSGLGVDVESLLVLSSVTGFGRPPFDGVRVNSRVELRGLVRREAPMRARSMVSGPVTVLASDDWSNCVSILSAHPKPNQSTLR